MFHVINTSLISFLAEKVGLILLSLNLRYFCFLSWIRLYYIIHSPNITYSFYDIFRMFNRIW